MNSRWHKSFWFTSRPQFFFASPAAPIVGADGGTGGDGSSTGGGSAPVQPSAPAAAPQINWTSAPQQFRDSYEQLKRQHEELSNRFKPYESLGKVEDIQRVQTQHTAAFNAAKQISDTLQIPEVELQQAINEHGLAVVLDQLRYEQWQQEEANAGNEEVLNEQDLNERIQRGIESAIQPIQDRENQRLVFEGNALVERTIGEAAAALLKTAGLDWNTAPAAYKDFVITGATEALKYDDAGMQGVKFRGQVAPIQKAFQEFTRMADAYYLARREMETGKPPVPRPGGGPPPPRNNGFKQPTFEEMENNPDLIRTSQGKAAYST